jgi:hypothetical protein
MDPDADPGGPKTYGSYGSGSGCESATLILAVLSAISGLSSLVLPTCLFQPFVLHAYKAQYLHVTYIKYYLLSIVNQNVYFSLLRGKPSA